MQWRLRSQAQQAAPANSEITTIHVQGNVYMLHGAGGNIAVQIGDLGVVVVDTGLAQNADKLIAAIRKLSDKPIQYIINTHVHADHTGGNDAMRHAGVTITGANVTGNLTDATAGAQIIAHENVLNRMSAPTGQQASAPFGAWPTITYVTGQNELHFNDEPIEARCSPTRTPTATAWCSSAAPTWWPPATSSSPPAIRLSIWSAAAASRARSTRLNNILDIAIPKHEEEGGTYIIPGHGRICDEFDVLEYRDMVTIIRDRIQNAIKKGMTLDQIKAAGWTKDYDAR